MKIFVSILLFCPFFGLSQNLDGKVPGLSSNNKELDLNKVHVFYSNESRHASENAVYFLNGSISDSSILKSINPNDFKDVKVIKNNPEYPQGIIELYLKDGVEVKSISLNDLLLKYTSIRSNSVIFMIDNVMIDSKSSSFLLNENNVLSITVKEYKHSDMAYHLISIKTKSEENIKEFKNPKLILRG